MFGGIFLLSGGSSKAVQQSPPIKASSRGEEDFIQYVPTTTCVIIRKDAHEERVYLGLTHASRKFLKDAEGESAKREGKH
jgi:hypothetical protein